MAGFQPIGFLRNSWRNSPWMIIAASAHVVLFAGLSVSFLGEHEQAKPPEDGVAIIPTERSVVEAPPPPEESFVRTPPARPDEEVEIVPDDVQVFLPPDLDPEAQRDWTQEVGNPDADALSMDLPTMSSTAISVGDGPGQRGLRVTPWSGRGRLFGTGDGTHGDRAITGVDKLDRAVVEGLRWLARHQQPDGSWSAAGLREMCHEDAPCGAREAQYGRHYDEGLTALALLAYLGAGFTHESRAFVADTVLPKRHVLGEVVKQGLKWLVERQNEDGSFTPGRPFLYNEALAAMALSEAYGLTRNRIWKEPAQRAIDFLVAAQKHGPAALAVPEGPKGANSTGTAPAGLWGWRYAARLEIEERRERGQIDDQAYAIELHDADTSVTTWCVMALKSAELSGLDVPRASLYGALDFMRWVTGQNGLVGYVDPAGAGLAVSGPNDKYAYHPAVMSALGMCSRTFIEHDLSDPFLEQAAAQLVKDLPADSADHLSVDYYYWYYGTLALNQFDGPDSPRRSGKYWRKWNEAMNVAVLALQDATEKVCSKGGWMVADRWCYAGGPIYATATNVLTLEVYYRYPNAFGMASKSGAQGVRSQAAGSVEEK